MEENLIFVNFAILDGGNEYLETHHFHMSYKDYENGIITDKDILIDFFGLDDEQIKENFEDEHTYNWCGALYMVKRVQFITREELDIVKRFCLWKIKKLFILE